MESRRGLGGPYHPAEPPHPKEGGNVLPGNGTTNESSVGDGGEGQWLHCEDQPDSIPESLRFNWFDMTCIIASIVTYVVDMGMDIYMACIYFESGFINYFVLTLVFVILPSVIMTAFSLRWYVFDMDNHTIPKPSCTKWVIRIVCLLLQMSPILRYVDACMYGLKSREAGRRNDVASQRKYYTLMTLEDADSTLLRLFEAFLEAAPQVTLQLFILIHHFNDESSPYAGRTNLQVFAVFTSLVSLAWSLAVYHRCLRYAQQDKTNISYRGTFLQFLWHMCSISARVFALAAFAATYPLLILPVCACHWMAMLAWLIVQQTTACETHCEEALFNIIVAWIYLFTFFNVRDEQTRYKYLTFYIICFMENTALLLTWLFAFDRTQFELDESYIFWFHVSGVVGDYLIFFLGILCMVLYYVKFHPTVSQHLQKNSTKTLSTTSVSDVTVKALSKGLARRGSTDISHLALGRTQSTSSSRRHISTSSHENYAASTSAGRNTGDEEPSLQDKTAIPATGVKSETRL